MVGGGGRGSGEDDPGVYDSTVSDEDGGAYDVDPENESELSKPIEVMTKRNKSSKANAMCVSREHRRGMEMLFVLDAEEEIASTVVTTVPSATVMGSRDRDGLQQKHVKRYGGHLQKSYLESTSR